MRLLIADDDRRDREAIAGILSYWGHEVVTADDGVVALEALETFSPSVIITDLKMPRMGGFELMKKLRAESRLPPTIVLTAFGSLEMAVSTIYDSGGFWFLEKPVDIPSLRVLIERAETHGRLEAELRTLREELSYRGAIGDMVGSSPRMKEVYSLIRQVAATNAPVLITGESGTGKELVARAIHLLGSRSSESFVAINCAAMPESLVESEIFGHEKGAFTGATDRRPGCLELAAKGTLFLDELGEMPLAIQAKLLRVLEEFHFRRLGGKQDLEADVRVLAATNRPPADALRDGKLREDLYYRLDVFQIEIPPLRERLEDLPALAEALIHRINQKHNLKVTGISSAVLSELMTRRWPGNVRELRNVLERAAILTGTGDIKEVVSPVEPIPETLAGSGSEPGVRVGMTIEESERLLIEATLKRVRNNKTHAALQLGISTKTLHAKLRKYRGEDGGGIEEDAEEAGAQRAGHL